MAATVSEGGGVDLTREDWPYQGQLPDDMTAAGYRDEEEPLAETDNAWNTQVREDIKRLNAELGDLEEDFGAHNHDSRYYQKTESDDRYVNEKGDTMTGSLSIESGLSVTDRSALSGGVDIGHQGQSNSQNIEFDDDGGGVRVDGNFGCFRVFDGGLQLREELGGSNVPTNTVFLNNSNHLVFKNAVGETTRLD